MLFSQPRKPEPAWACRFAGLSSKNMGVGSGPRRARNVEWCSICNCHAVAPNGSFGSDPAILRDPERTAVIVPLYPKADGLLSALAAGKRHPELLTTLPRERRLAIARVVSPGGVTRYG